MMPLIRTASFGGFRELVTKLGMDPAPFLARFRIDADLLEDENAKVPLRSLVGLLEYTAQELRCPDFGLRMAEYQSLNVLGPIALTACSAATVSHALADIVRFIGYHSSGILLDFDRSEAHSPRLLLSLKLPGLLQQQQMTELAMGVAHNTIKSLCGTDLKTQLVQLSGIGLLPLSRYRCYFKTTVYTGQACNALVLTAEQLNQQVKPRDPALHRTLVQCLSQLDNLNHTCDLVDQVRRLILRLLPTQHCRLVLIAEQLGMHERVLQRRLADSGHRFEEIVEAIRRDRAEYYLAERDIPMAQIASMLGYSEQSVFNRACRRWFAQSPSARRREILAQRSRSIDFLGKS